MNNEISTVISSPSDRENVVFEIWIGGNQFAEISNEPDSKMMIEIYQKPDGTLWTLEIGKLKKMIYDAEINLNQPT